MNRRTNHLIIILLPAIILTLTARATPAAESVQPADARGVKYDQLVSLSARVEAIDKAKREVTLRGPEGRQVSLKVGDEVRNLPQVKVGDMVVVRYYESIALKLKKGAGEPDAAAAGVAGRAAEGEKPAVAGAATVVADVTVEHIESKSMIVTVKGPRGNVFDVKARDPERVAALKVGDVIRVTYTQALAVSIEPASP